MHPAEQKELIEFKWVAAALLGAAIAALLMLATGSGAHLVVKAAGLPTSGGQGFAKIGAMVNALKTPLLYTAATILPLALIAGAISWGMGSRRGVQIMGQAIGAMMLLAVVSGVAS